LHPVAERSEEPTAGLGTRLLTNMSMLSVSQGLGLLISIVTVGVLTRHLPDAEWAAYGLAFAVLSVGLTLADPGLSTTLVRDLAQEPERSERLLAETLALRVALALVVVIGIWLYAGLMLDDPNRTAVQVISLVVLTQALATPTTVLQARVLVSRGIVIELVNRLVGFGAMMGAIAAGWGVAGALAGVVIGDLAAQATLYRVVSTLVRVRLLIDWTVWRRRLRLSVSVAGATMLSIIVARFDFFMLERMSPALELAHYNSAYRLPMLLERVPLLALSTIFPLMSSLAASDPAGLTRMYRWALVRAVGLAAAMLAVTWPLAPAIVRLWMGDDALPAVPAMRWLLASTACMYIAVVAGNLLIVRSQAKRSVGIWMIAVPINLGLNWFWIPTHGAEGAAAATCIATAYVLVATLFAASHSEGRV
jgi:O-antigen/teichoic acid export membrane protein